jgi:hypothetical protein
VLSAVTVQRDGDEGGEGGGLLDRLRRRVSGLTDAVRSGWSSISSAAQSGFSAVTDGIGAGVRGLGRLGSDLFDRVRAGATAAGDTANKLVSGLTDGLRRGVQMFAGVLGGLRDAVVSMDPDAIGGAWNNASGAIDSVWGGLQDAGSALHTRLTALWVGVESLVAPGLEAVSSQADALTARLRGAAEGVRDRLASAWAGLESRASALGGIGSGAPGFVRAIIDRLVAAGRSLWERARTQFDALRQRAESMVEAARSQVRGVLDTLRASAGRVVDGLRSQFEAVRNSVTGAAQRVLGGVFAVWQNIKRFSISGVVEKLRAYVGVFVQVEEAAKDPDAAMQPYADAITTKVEGEMPNGAGDKLREHLAKAGAPEAALGDGGKARGSPVLATVQRAPATPVQRQGEERSTAWGGIWSGVWAAINEKWANVKIGKLVVDTLKNFIWPWPAVWGEIKGLWADWKSAAGSLFSMRSITADPLGFLHDLWSNVLRLVDFPLILWRRLNNILMLLWGWIAIALTILGAVGGALAGGVIGGIVGALGGGVLAPPGAAAGAGAGGLGGAGAGLGAALLLGEAFFFSFVAAEAASLIKTLLQLATARGTGADKAKDFSTAADNSLSLGIAAILFFIGVIGSKIAAAVADMVRGIVPEGLANAASKFAKGVESTRPPRPSGYEGVDTAKPPVGLTVIDLPVETLPSGAKRLTTVVEAGGESGHVTRTYDPATGKLTLEEAFLDKIPQDLQWVEVDGKRMRLQTYLTLRQMRSFGIGFGALRVVKMSTIQNIRTIVEFHLKTQGGMPPERAIMDTHSIQYTDRTLQPAASGSSPRPWMAGRPLRSRTCSSTTRPGTLLCARRTTSCFPTTGSRERLRCAGTSTSTLSWSRYRRAFPTSIRSLSGPLGQVTTTSSESHHVDHLRDRAQPGDRAHARLRGVHAHARGDGHRCLCRGCGRLHPGLRAGHRRPPPSRCLPGSDPCRRPFRGSLAPGERERWDRHAPRAAFCSARWGVRIAGEHGIGGGGWRRRLHGVEEPPGSGRLWPPVWPPMPRSRAGCELPLPQRELLPAGGHWRPDPACHLRRLPRRLCGGLSHLLKAESIELTRFRGTAPAAALLGAEKVYQAGGAEVRALNGVSTLLHCCGLGGRNFDARGVGRHAGPGFDVVHQMQLMAPRTVGQSAGAAST